MSLTVSRVSINLTRTQWLTVTRCTRDLTYTSPEFNHLSRFNNIKRTFYRTFWVKTDTKNEIFEFLQISKFLTFPVEASSWSSPDDK